MKLPQKQHTPRALHLVVDGTYWGERTEDTDWCSVVARDPYTKEDLWWKFVDQETTTVYREMRRDLEALGYTILSVTGDGFSGIKSAFSSIPYQMCQVHMKRLIIKGTTRKPLLEAGQVLLLMAKTLKDMDSHTMRIHLNEFTLRYRDFLNQKSINPETGHEEWTHRGVRSAWRSLLHFMPDLFTFEHDSGIYKHTNSIEGHFSHIRDVINVHRGLSRTQKERALHTLFLCGSISDDECDLGTILS